MPSGDASKINVLVVEDDTDLRDTVVTLIGLKAYPSASGNAI